MMTRSRRLSVTAVLGSGVLGGAERWLLQLLDSTDRLDVDAVLLSGGALEDELAARAMAYTVIETGPRPVDAAAAAWALGRRLRRHRVDVVLANGGKAPAAAIPAGAIARTRVLWAKHDFARDDGAARLFARLSDAVVATSQPLLDSVGATGTVITPPRPSSPPDAPGEARQFWERRGVAFAGGPMAVMVGRLDPHKGHDAALRALASGASQWRLVIVGDDDPVAPGTREQLTATSAALGVSDRVWFAGGVADAGRRLGAFDAALVLPDAGPHGYPLEGFGIFAMEAFLAGVPVVGISGVPALGLQPDAVELSSGRDPREVAAALGRVRNRVPAARLDAAHLWKVLPQAEEQADKLVSLLAGTAARAGAGAVSRPPVTVISTVLNEEASVGALLDTLRRQGGRDDEIVVVDGGSHDATPDIVTEVAGEDARVRFVSAPGANIAEGRNLAVRHATHGVIVSTDGGCRHDDDWLDAMAAPFADLAPPGLVLGMYLPVSETPFDRAMTVSHYPVPEEAGHPSLLSRLYSRLFGLRYDPTLPTGRTMAFSVDAWESAGGYPENLYAAEDVTFGRAVDAAGFRCVLTTDARVHWRHRPDARATAKMFYVYGVGDGRSGSRLLIARDVVRAAAYVVAPLMFLRGGRATKAAVLAAGAFYVSLPAVRTKEMPGRAGVLARIPVAMALKDLPKVAGCAVGIWARIRGDESHAGGGRFADRPTG